MDTLLKPKQDDYSRGLDKGSEILAHSILEMIVGLGDISGASHNSTVYVLQTIKDMCRQQTDPAYAAELETLAQEAIKAISGKAVA